MKIIRFNAENFKRLVAVEITPEGNLVEIAGRNGQGKTSILDAIWVALGGLEAAPKKPIRDGELEARIELALGTDKPEIVVVRTFKPKTDGSEITSNLRVENAEGARYTSPQAMLDKLLGALAFDPLAFDRMDARAQFDTLRRFVPGVDFDAIDMANRADYDKRTVANRKAKEARASAALIKVAGTPPAKIDEAALAVELENAGKHNADIEMRKANRQRIQMEIGRHQSDIDRRRDVITLHRAEIASIERMIKDEEAAIVEQDRMMREKAVRLEAAPPLADPIDTTAIREKLDAARLHNAGVDEVVRLSARRAEHVKLAAEQEAIAAQLTEAIDMREVNKRRAIAEAKLPIDGISFGDNEVLLRGQPWSQASDAERLVASMQMAMAMNPKLRIIRVRDGSLLDEDSLKLVASMAKDNDFQVWIERVSSDGNVGIIIEDGRVKQVHQEKAAKA